MTHAASCGDFGIACGTAGALAQILINAGRYDDAFRISKQAEKFVQLGGFGPWSRLNVEAQALQILLARGRAQAVLQRVTDLRHYMEMLVDHGDTKEIAQRWNVCEW